MPPTPEAIRRLCEDVFYGQQALWRSCLIPPNVPHAERNDGDEPAVAMECFAPVLEELLRKTFEQRILG